MVDHLGEHQGHSLALTEGMYAKGDKRAHSPPTLRARRSSDIRVILFHDIQLLGDPPLDILLKCGKLITAGGKH